MNYVMSLWGSKWYHVGIKLYPLDGPGDMILELSDITFWK